MSKIYFYSRELSLFKGNFTLSFFLCFRKYIYVREDGRVFKYIFR